MKRPAAACVRKRLGSLLLILLLASALLPFTALAQGSGKTVRVGWYESPFNTMDDSGRRSGYAYDYQMKLAAYSGWNYVYVTGSWPDLLDMLSRGEIDLLSDVSYTPERAGRMLFPELSMGTEEYCIFIAPGNREITADDPSTLNGRRVGVNRDSVQKEMYLSWAAAHGVEAELAELSGDETEAWDMLSRGELDALVTLNAYGDPERLTPVCRIGSSDFYFAVSKDRPDLLNELNAALNRIQDENPYYNQRLFERYVQRFGSNAFLTAAEEAWLEAHGPVRVGYQDGYLAFCASDPTTGALKGALKDYLEAASDCLTNARIGFTAAAYPTAADALAALERGEVDCVFPANLGSYDGETRGVVMTPALMRTEIYAVVRQSEQDRLPGSSHVIVAVNRGNPNYDAFLLDNCPDWRAVYYPTTADCLKAVSDRVADCVLISSYRYNNIARLCEKYRLTAIATGMGLDYCFAVAEGQTELYSILAKTVGLVPGSAVSAALSRYIAEDARQTLGDFLSAHLGWVIAGVAAVLLVVLALLLRSVRAERRSKALISATEIDRLTGLYNRDYFFQYAERMRKEHPGAKYDAVVLDIEQFHSVNALNGREFGDRVLWALGDELRAVAEGSGGIAGRFGADRFGLWCRAGEDWRTILDRLQGRLTELAPDAAVRLRMGVMPWEAELDPVVQFDRARTACSMARGKFKERLIVFNDAVREQELLDRRLQNDFRRALDSYEFEVYYQPKYDIRGDRPRLASAEALVRWQHPELGLLTPDRFIPLFERNGSIYELDKYVWGEAARQVSRWRDQLGVTVPVSVNLSRVDVFEPTLEAALDEILSRCALERGALKLEVTETAYTENADQLVRVMERLHSKGFVVEMDDFGTGYSSLNMLSSLPIDALKMDRSFIQNLGHDEKDAQMVELILGIADRLKIPVIAEGVESEEQLQLLKKLGCELVQGFYFSRPLHPADFEDSLLRNES